MRARYLLVATFVVIVVSLLPHPATWAQNTDGVDNPPFSLPLTDPPGPTTWLFDQAYGNTTQAFNYGDVWYLYGQGLHFGVDFEAPCGTPVHAIADGVVVVVDSEPFGAGPHNLVLKHPGTGYTSLYGHLLQTPDLKHGDQVKRGQQIGLTGDPDGTCGSRPHLHLEIRSPDFQTAYNPLPFFDVNWDMLVSVGPNNNNFQQDLDTPHRWMKLTDQPNVEFSGNTLNNYVHPWPPRLESRAPVNPPTFRHLDPLPDGVQIEQSAVSPDAWNLGAWWNPRDLNAVYLIDAIPGQPTGVFRQPLDGSPREYVQPAPPDLFSPDGAITVRRTPDAYMRITRETDGMAWQVTTEGVYPAVSPDDKRLLWELVYGDIVPGSSTPAVAMIVSNIDGSLVRRVYTQSGGYSMWLDAHRLLIVKRPPFTAETQLYILDIDDPKMTPELLGIYPFLHRLEVAPGGGMIAYFLPFQKNPDDSGVYVQSTEPGSTARKLPFFGAYQWRDDHTLFTLSYDLTTDAHALGVVDVQTGDVRTLTDPADLPIRIANGDWSVSPDGTRIVYVDSVDFGLYLLTIR
jgi:murein DD-endopeptidase MepM/ murein hydrolase activator NlpD